MKDLFIFTLLLIYGNLLFLFSNSKVFGLVIPLSISPLPTRAFWARNLLSGNNFNFSGKVQGENYNRDEIAQSACIGLSRGGGWIYAVRKACPGPHNCNQICAMQSLKNQDGQIKNER